MSEAEQGKEEFEHPQPDCELFRPFDFSDRGYRTTRAEHIFWGDLWNLQENVVFAKIEKFRNSPLKLESLDPQSNADCIGVPHAY